MEGRVEIFYIGEWGTVCDDFWDLTDAVVVCRQLGYTTAVRRSIGAEFGEGTGKIWLDNVACNGTESMLSSCTASLGVSHNCYHVEDAGAVCQGKLLLLHQFANDVTLCSNCIISLLNHSISYYLATENSLNNSGASNATNL